MGRPIALKKQPKGVFVRISFSNDEEREAIYEYLHDRNVTGGKMSVFLRNVLLDLIDDEEYDWRAKRIRSGKKRTENSRVSGGR